LSFSPWDPPIVSRVAGVRFIAAAGKLLAETTGSAYCQHRNEYITADCGGTNPHRNCLARRSG
jgi:hypothetical protein